MKNIIQYLRKYDKWVYVYSYKTIIKELSFNIHAFYCGAMVLIQRRRNTGELLFGRQEKQLESTWCITYGI